MKKIYAVLLVLCFFCSYQANANPTKNHYRKEVFEPFNVDQPADVTVCNGATTSTIVFTSTVPGTTFTWVNNNTTIGLGASGSGDITPFTATNTGTSPVVAIITVTPSSGTAKTFTITVNPSPTVNNVPNQSVCHNSSTTAVNFTGSVAGTNYSWTNNNITIGLAASGTGNIGAFTATNTGTAPVVATVTVTPLTGSGGSSGIFAYIPNFNSDNVSVINTATNTVVTTVTVGSGPYGVAVSPDGSRVYVTNSGSNNVSVINTVTNTVVATVAVGTRPYGIVVSPDGSKVYVANFLSNVVSIINTASNTIVTNVTVGSGPYGVAVSPDGSMVYVTNTNSSTVTVVNTATNTVVTTVTVGSNPRGIIVSPDGSKVYVANISSNSVSVINTATNAVDATVTVGQFPSGITVSPNGSRVFVANSGSSNNVSVINTATNAVEATVAVGNSPNGISVSPNGSRVYVANSGTSNSVSVINTATNAVVATVTVGTTPYAFGNFISNSGTTCTGAPITYTYTVNPIPTAVATPSNQSGCSGTAITTIALSGTVNGTTYNWTRDNTVSVTGIAASGSGNISGTLTNTTAAPVTVTFTITPTANGCPGTAITATIIVEPTPTVDAVANQTVCNGASTTAVNFTSPMAGTIFNWTNNNTSIGLAASGTGNIPSFTPIFSGTTPVTATITVTPSFSGGSACVASPQTFTITVNPIPNVNNVPSQTVCNNAATAAINFTGTVPGTNYTWTNSNPTIGLPASGTGNIPSFTALNTTGSPITSTITITPSFGGAQIIPELLYYKFDGAGTTVPNLASNPPAGTTTANFNGTMSQGGNGICGGALQSNSSGILNYLNTNWAAIVNSSWSISFITSGFSGVASTTIRSVFGSNINSSGNSIIGNYIPPVPGGNGLGRMQIVLNGNTTIVMTAEADYTTTKTVTIVYNNTTNAITVYVDGVVKGTQSGDWTINASSFHIGNCDGSTAGAINSGASIDEFRMYNRAINASEIQSLVNNCGSGSVCIGSPEIFGITVNPSPIVNPVSSQNVCTSNNTAAINFTGNVAGATYNWINSNPSIGLAASGTGNIASFVATNTGSTTQTATITVTPVDPNSSCLGTPEIFTIAVNPVPTGTATPASQIICSADAINTITFTGNVPGITFDWTRDNLATVTGILGVGNGNINGTLTNTTNAVVTVTFTVTPSIGGCVGTPFTVTVDVRPQFLGATVSPTSQTICSNNAIATITPSGPVAGTTYTWVRDNTTAVTGIAASGSGNISGSLINTTALPVTVTFTITPISPFGCIGTPITSSVLVNPRPNAITTPVNQQVCNGVNIVPIALTSSTPGTTFTWTRDNTVSVSGGIPASGGGSTISGFMINSTNAPVTVTFTITPTANGCVGTTTTATVLVYPTATAVATPATQTSCSGSPITNINLSGPVANTVFSWTRDNVANATGIPASGTGNINGTLTTTATTPITVTFTIIPSINGCAGPAITATDTVKPTPTVNQPLDQVLCNGATTTAVTFNSAISGTTFNWTNNAPSIGLAASGTGNIPSFTAINTTSVQVNAIITVTPTAAGCAGVSRTFIIRVNPTAVVNPVSNQVLCTGSATNAVNFTGPVAGTTYSWTNSNTSIGLAASGTGNIPSFTAINNTPNAVTATITVTPNSPAGCVGIAKIFTITVSGNSVAANAALSTVTANCGATTTNLSVQGGALGTGASWKWYAGSCGSATLIGTGATLNNVPVNTTTTFFVRAEGTCNTTSCVSVTVVINEVPTISIVATPYTALTPLLKTNITSTITPVQLGNVIEWFKDNNLSPIGTGTSLNNINVDQVGSYTAKITTAQGCTATSNVVAIKDSVTSQLFVYPNPNNGQFKIRYYIPDNVLSVVRKVIIVDSKGALVYNQRISVSNRWGAMDINIRGAAQGVYFIKLLDINEKEIVGTSIQVLR